MQSDVILKLGKRIVDELGLDQTVDTLGRWMAHYIAELIQGAEAAQGNDRTEKMSSCASAIMDLWVHRSALPDGKRPFEDFEPILRSLESLDPNDNTSRYFRSVRTAAGKEELHAETKKWLDMVEEIDSSARILIRYCLTRAAENAMDKSKEWVKLAEAIDAEEGIDLRAIRLIKNENDIVSSSSQDEITSNLVEDRIQRLENFLKMAKKLSSDLRKKLHLFVWKGSRHPIPPTIREIF